MRFVSFFLSFFLFSAICLAEETEPTVESPDYSITVTADRLEQSVKDSTDDVTVISSDEIEQQQNVTVLEALRNVSGLAVVQSGSPGKTTSVFLRGAGSAQTMVLLDGIEINNPFFGGVDFANFLTTGVERIEILKGPQSPLYGSEAMAGVINIITGSGSEKTAGGAFFEAGGMETLRGGAQISGKTGILKYSASVSEYDTQGQFENDEFNDLQINSRFDFALDERSSILVNANYIDSHIGIPFNGRFPTPDRNSDNKLGVVAVGYSFRSNSLLNLLVRGSYVRREFHFEDPLDAFSPLSEDESNNYKITIQNNSTFDSNTFTLGYEQESQDVTADDALSEIVNDTVNSRSVFAQDKFQWGAFFLTAGGRYDHHSSFGDHFSPRVSAAYQLNEDWKIRGGAGSAFRAPSVGELVYPFYGNPDLKPETCKSVEAGVDWTRSGGSLSVTGYYSTYKDLITFDPVTFIAANIDRARIYGFEISSAYPLAKNWTLSGSYAFVKTKDETTDEPLFRRPENSGSLTLNYSQTRWGWNANFLFVGKRFEQDFELFVNRFNSGYTRGDLAGYYRIARHFKITGRIENFYDSEYEEAFGFPAPGVTGYAGIHLEL
jgi:vitamin B12 transporter